MDRRTIIIILLFVVVCVASLYALRRSNSTVRSSCKTHHDRYSVVSYHLSPKTYNLLLADSPAKWEYGLMNVKSKKDICGNDGMMFTFPIAMPQTFWNKNTLVDLDIYWMNGEKKVGQDKLPAITKSGLTTISSPEAVERVVEIIR